MGSSKGIFPLFYLGPISYYSSMLQYAEVCFDLHEHFPKQTFRNRCGIYGANGRLNLIVPVKHTGEKRKTGQAAIANDQPWQKLHWKSFEAAYRSSPFFEYYEDDLKPFYQNRFDLLTEFNGAIHRKVMESLSLPASFTFTGQYQQEYPDADDHRNKFPTRPAAEMPSVAPHSYTQVFGNKYGYIHDLSIIDLLFNAGPNAPDYLRKRNS